MSYEDMRPEDQKEMADLRKLLYRAVRELNYIIELAPELVESRHQPMIASSEGTEVVESGMKLLGCADLAEDDLPRRLVTA